MTLHINWQPQHSETQSVMFQEWVSRAAAHDPDFRAKDRILYVRDFHARNTRKSQEAHRALIKYWGLAKILDAEHEASLYADPENTTRLVENIDAGDDTIWVRLATYKEACFQEFERLSKKFYPRFVLPRSDMRDKVCTLIATPSGMQLHVLASGFEKFHPENYSAAAVDGFKLVRESIESEQPPGRLILLDGPPGTGKTYFVRGLVEAAEAYFILIPSHAVSAIASPEIVPLLHQANSNRPGTPICLIVEDADRAVLPRMNDNMSEIAALLNMTDGILGESLNLFVLATTNAHKHEVEPALLREGRLLARIHVSELPASQASGLLKRLVPEAEDFSGDVKLSAVYAKARELGWKPPKKAVHKEPRRRRIRRRGHIEALAIK